MRAAWGGGSGLVPALRIAPLDRWLHIVEASTAPRTVVCASPLRSNREFQRRGRGRAGQVRARAGARPARQHMYLEMYYRRAVQGDVQFRGDIIPIYIPVESASALADMRQCRCVLGVGLEVGNNRRCKSGAHSLFSDISLSAPLLYHHPKIGRYLHHIFVSSPYRFVSSPYSVYHVSSKCHNPEFNFVIIFYVLNIVRHSRCCATLAMPVPRT